MPQLNIELSDMDIAILQAVHGDALPAVIAKTAADHVSISRQQLSVSVESLVRAAPPAGMSAETLHSLFTDEAARVAWALTDEGRALRAPIED